MTSDRELLELAAKAAGMNTRPFATNSVTLWHERGPQDVTAWNPLTGDGDALRLAVALWIELRVFNGKAHAGQQNRFWCTEFVDSDPCAATRRAITKAAAELGKQGGDKP